MEGRTDVLAPWKRGWPFSTLVLAPLASIPNHPPNWLCFRPSAWPLLTQVAVLSSFAPIPNWLCSALFVALSRRRSACRARSWDKIPVWSFVGVPFDTLKILFHAPTQCQRWHQRVAFTFMAATPVHLAQANHHVPLANSHAPYPTPSSATRNWGRFACVIRYEMLRFSAFSKVQETRFSTQALYE